MPFGRMIKKLTKFLSPKEHAATEEKSRHWEPLEIKKEINSSNAEAPMPRHEKSYEKNILAASRPNIRGRLAEAHAYFKSSRKASILLIAGIITVLFYKYVIPIYVILIFIAVASASKLIQDWIFFVVGFDLVLFVTVLSGMAYGWKVALIVGPLSSIIGSSLRRIMSQQFDAIVFPAIGYALVAVVLPFLPPMSLFGIGMVCTFIYVGFNEIVFAYLRPDLMHHTTFVVTSLVFNYWLFKNFAEPIFSVISVIS